MRRNYRWQCDPDDESAGRAYVRHDRVVDHQSQRRECCADRRHPGRLAPSDLAECATPFRLTTTAPHGTTTRLVLSVSVFVQDAATCSIVVNGSAVASASTSSYRTPAVCQWG
jgi:hypothetical protein